jgi:CRP-like cAMP-binding protein
VPNRTDPATIALLGHIALFSGCNRRQLGVIARHMTEMEVAQGTVVVKEGEPADEAFVIIEGVAHVELNGEKLSDLGEGDFFGELSLLDGGPRTATVIAESPMFVLMMNAEQLEQVVRSAPAVALTMLKELSRRLRKADARLD